MIENEITKNNSPLIEMIPRHFLAKEWLKASA